MIQSELLMAQFKCIDYFNDIQRPGVIERNRDLDEAIAKKRTRSIKRVRLQEIKVNGVAYEVVGLLGVGSSKVYLARSSDSQLVVIKHLKKNGEVSADWVYSIYYEAAVTRYYLSKGLLVPRVIDFEIIEFNNKIKEGFLVKEYRVGLTHEEFLEFNGLDFLRGESYNKMDEAYDNSESKISKVHSGFKKWLKENKINLSKYSFSGLEALIKYGDFSGGGHQNWIFDLETYQWVLIDP